MTEERLKYIEKWADDKWGGYAIPVLNREIVQELVAEVRRLRERLRRYEGPEAEQ